MKLLNQVEPGNARQLEVGYHQVIAGSGRSLQPFLAAPHRLSRGSFRDAYWTAAQIVAHQTSNGCNLQPGDLLGSGTLSGAAPETA